jgi:hypothetical protein
LSADVDPAERYERSQDGRSDVAKKVPAMHQHAPLK